MASITLDHVFDAMLIMLVMTVVAISIVGGLMYWLYRFFKNKPSEQRD